MAESRIKQLRARLRELDEERAVVQAELRRLEFNHLAVLGYGDGPNDRKMKPFIPPKKGDPDNQ